MRPYLDSDYTQWDALTTNARVRPVFFVVVDFGSPAYSPITAIYDDGFGWDMDGAVHNIVFPEQALNGDKPTFSLTLSGLNPDFLNDAVLARQDIDFPTASYDIPASSIDIWFFDEDGSINSEASYPICAGLLDECEIEYGPDGILVHMTFEASTNFLWDRPVEGRYTDALQKSLGNPSYSTSNPFYNDGGFRFVEALQNWEVFWGKPTPAKKPGKKKEKGKPDKRHRRRK